MKTMLLFPAVAILLSLNTVSANEGNSLEVSAALAMLDAKNVIEHHYQFCRDKAGDQVVLPPYVRTRPIRNVAPFFQVEHGAIAELVAA
jgi:hypothetical protein